MRSLALLGLIALSTLPLAAHDHGWHRGWRDRDDRRPRLRVEDRGWDRDRCHVDRYYLPERWGYRRDCDDDAVMVVRPLPRRLVPPWRTRVVLRFDW